LRRSHQEVAELGDEALVRLVASRQADAFEELYRRHSVAVSAIASRTVNDRGCADEATQSAFLSLWRRAAQLDVRSSSVRPWLIIVARNAAIDAARRRHAAERLDTPRSTAGETRLPEEIVMQREAERAVHAALATLDDVQREALHLAFFGGLSQSEIAQVTGAPLGTVKGRIRLAMRHLRTILAPQAGDAT
jgi:RNA polymerase sigma-70 factor (ECF subfamily)